MRISAIYLAAGQSVRMGRAKQLLELAEQVPLASMGLRALCRSRSKIEHIAVVVDGSDGAPLLHKEWLAGTHEESHREEVRVVCCRGASQGMAHSLRAGMLELLRIEPQLDAVVVMLADQPFVSPAMIDRLVENMEENAGLDYAAYQLQNGAASPPALLARTMFGAVLLLDGDAGARRLFTQSQYKGVVLMPATQELLFDIDTPEQLEQARAYYLDKFGCKSTNHM